MFTNSLHPNIYVIPKEPVNTNSHEDFGYFRATAENSDNLLDLVSKLNELNLKILSNEFLKFYFGQFWPVDKWAAEPNWSQLINMIIDGVLSESFFS